jgi:hypothetical protein
MPSAFLSLLQAAAVAAAAQTAFAASASHGWTKWSPVRVPTESERTDPARG